MSAASETGPFRRDARIERTADIAPPALAWDVMRRRALPSLDIPGYFATLGVATVSMGVALGTSVPALGVGAVLLLFAFGLHKRWRALRRERGSEPDVSRCVFTSDAMLLESSLGRTAWPYAAIRSVHRYQRWVVVATSDHQALVLCAEGEAGAALASWIAARATHLSNEPSRTRTLLLLAVLYVLLAAAVVVVLPSFIAR